MKLKDILNPKFNKSNNQISFDLRKKIVKDSNLNIDKILEMEIKKEKNW
jgi:hypothetical protein